VVERIADDYPATQLLLWAAIVVATVIVVRFVWVFPATYVPRWVSRRLRERDPSPPWKHVLLVAWTGMRGAVSLAAALAIPLTTDDGAPFPGRDLIIFLVYTTILATILLQGLSLAPLIRRLGIQDDGRAEHLETKARIKAARRAVERLDELLVEDWVAEAGAQRLRALYEFRIRRLKARFDEGDDGALDEGSLAWRQLRREVLEAERAELIRLRNAGTIGDDVLHRIEHDLDLETARLERDAAPRTP
jgi:NhaP-type Na+/H+ or K+/H+ antiporter